MTYFCALAFLSSIVILSTSQPALAADLSLTLENGASDTLVETYAAPRSAPHYSEHVVAHAPMSPQQAHDVTLENVLGCSFNIMAVFENQGVIERQGLDLCRGRTLRIQDDTIVIGP